LVALSPMLTTALIAKQLLFVPVQHAPMRPLRTAVAMKTDDWATAPPVRLEPEGTIAEFDDGKHNRALLGIVLGSVAKAKGGGARYEVIDANNKVHSVAQKSIHCTCGKAKPDAQGLYTDPADALKRFQQVADSRATELGVEPEMLELAWEMCQEKEGGSFSPESIVATIDEKLCVGAVNKYKAFRLLTSDLGKVFFKPLGGNRFKAKASKAVQTSKEMWCRAVEEISSGGSGEEFCLV